MSSIAGHGCERIVPEEAKKTLEEIERSIVIITKKKNTPSKYPRAGNKPRTNPIK